MIFSFSLNLFLFFFHLVLKQHKLVLRVVAQVGESLIFVMHLGYLVFQLLDFALIVFEKNVFGMLLLFLF